MTTITTFDEVRDLAINIVDELVESELVPNCIDTDNEEEFNFQDAIIRVLCNKFNIANENEE